MCMLMDFTYVVLSHQIKQNRIQFISMQAHYCIQSNVQKK